MTLIIYAQLFLTFSYPFPNVISHQETKIKFLCHFWRRKKSVGIAYYGKLLLSWLLVTFGIFLVSVLLSSHIKRLVVSRMQDFFMMFSKHPYLNVRTVGKVHMFLLTTQAKPTSNWTPWEHHPAKMSQIGKHNLLMRSMKGKWRAF